MENEAVTTGGSAALDAPFEEFTRFPDFPTEVRLQIWHEALSVPQKVVFSVVQTPFDSHRRAFLKRVTPLSPLFYVSRESREEAHRAYAKKGYSSDGKEDVWDIWRYFRFGVDICVLENQAKVPWTFLVGALGRESAGLEIIMGRKQIAMR
jgi:hypothetical protein